MPPDAATSRKAPVDWTQIRARVASAASFHGGQTDETILRRRAQALARPPRADVNTVELVQVVVFDLSGQSFGIEAAYVRETLAPRELTTLPGLPSTVAGLVNIRSRVVPAFDLRPLLQLPPSPAPDTQRLLLAENDRTEFAILVDAIVGSREASLAGLRREVAGLHQHLLRGLFEDGLALLDLPSVFGSLVVTDDRQDFRRLTP